MADLTQEYVKSLFEYKDGNLFWKSDRSKGKIKAGDKAGSLTSHGYKRVTIDYKEYPLHKVIYLWAYGYMPDVIDHIDCNPLNNLFENLRKANYQTNAYNKKMFKTNTSGCKNVSWNKKGQTWQIHIRHNKKVKCWYVKDFELAELVAQEARNKFHGEFANHG